MNPRLRLFRQIALASTIICFVVVVLGAWARLTDAGLGCPDWPGCYGQVLPPEGEAIAEANAAYPERPVDVGKAWNEMIHRYAVGVLGIAVLVLAGLAWVNRKDPDQPVVLPLLIVPYIIMQALFGMWTVTLLLKPAIVTTHLILGMGLFAMLGWLALPSRRQAEPLRAMPAAGASPAVGAAPVETRREGTLRRLAVVALGVVAVQIFLGGWVSTNYAALACPDFPRCQTAWWPAMDFGTGFKPWHGVGIDYEGGILHNSARVAIHVAHRLGAIVTVLVLGAIVLWLWRQGTTRLRIDGALMAAALAAQVAIGVLIVKLSLPLPLAAAHNGMAALLLLTIINLNKTAWRGS